MATRVGGFRRKTRSKLKKNAKLRGKISIRTFFQGFKVGDHVVLVAEPAIQKGMYFPRYHGKSGIIKGKQGKCYQVAFKDGNKLKTAITHPIHLKRA